eukprot:5504375-Pyramimonas_sp.AAC.1
MTVPTLATPTLTVPTKLLPNGGPPFLLRLATIFTLFPMEATDRRRVRWNPRRLGVSRGRVAPKRSERSEIPLHPFGHQRRPTPARSRPGGT